MVSNILLSKAPDRPCNFFGAALVVEIRCGHCKKLAPDWEKLSQEWEGDDTGLVAEVDCTADGKSICDDNGVQGFPTLKYGDPSNLDDYLGGRSYSDLSSFAMENLKPVCQPSKLDLCDDEAKSLIREYMTLSSAELERRIDALNLVLRGTEELFLNETQKLQNGYDKLTEEKSKKLAEIRTSGLSLMKSVKAAKIKDAKEEL